MDEFYRPAPSPRPRPERFPAPRPTRGMADADLTENDSDGGEPFLRTRRRVPVRKGLLASIAPDWAQKWVATRWGILALGLIAAALLAGVVALGFAVRNFLDCDPRFRIDSSASVQTMGNSQLTRPELLSVFGSDIGRNLFFVPLAQRRLELEQIPWVEHATVMRLLPNQLRVAVTERTPIAFVRLGSKIELVDKAGVILDMPPSMMAAKHYSFPVVTGINPAAPLSTRGARMQLYQKFIAGIDATGEKVSEQLSEVDLSDPEDVRVTVPAKGSDLVLHFGDENFLDRWHNYQSHIGIWQQQYPHLGSIDLRYEKEVVLKMAGSADVQPAAASDPQPTAPATAAVSAAKPHPVKHAAARAAKHHPAKGKR